MWWCLRNITSARVLPIPPKMPCGCRSFTTNWRQRSNMANGFRTSGFASELRRELCARNEAFAKEHSFTHVLSYGTLPVIVYSPEADGIRHGNFIAASYAEMLKRPQWARRLNKIHAQGKRAL